MEKFSVGQRLGLDLAERGMSNVSLFANIKKEISEVGVLSVTLKMA